MTATTATLPRSLPPILTPRRGNIILAALTCAVLPPVTARLMPHWFTGSVAVFFAVGTSTVVAAMALNVLMGYAGQVSLGHAALLAAGAYTSGLLTSNAGFPLPFFRVPGGQSMLVGIAAAGVVGGLVALIIGFPALRLRGLHLAVVTMAFGFAMTDAFLHLPAISKGSAGVNLPRNITPSFTLVQDADYLAFALLVVLLLWLIDDNLVRSKVGRAFHGIRENDALAQAYAIDVSRYKLLAFIVSGAMAGIAGALYGHSILFTNGDDVPFVFEASLALVVIVVVGGLGSRLAVVLAATAFVVTPKLFDLVHVPEAWAAAIGPLLLMVTVVRHPGGFAELLGDLRERRHRRKIESERRDQPGADDDPASTRIPELGLVAQVAPAVKRPEVAGKDLLVVDDVTVRFGGVLAVDGASLSVARGQIVGLIGPNGAGKSTLFNAIGGYLRPESGRIQFFGQDVHDLPAHRRARLGMGRTFQNIGLARNLTVLENLLMAQHHIADYDVASALAYLPRTARVERDLEQRAWQALKAIGFEEFAYRKAGNLSGGQQRILEMACVLITGPELLMLDEPSAGMSPGAAENLAMRLRDLRDRLGRTVLLIEHNVPMVLDVCDYIYVLNYGAVLAHGSTEAIARRPEVIAAYFGEQVA